jgi:AcrR family transcriptional regulator
MRAKANRVMLVRPGRRPLGSRKLDSTTIIAKGLALTKTVPLQEVSIVRLAREFGVTPASIHYYFDGRDQLTSGIINLFVGEIVRAWPNQTGNWKVDLETVAEAIYRWYVRYPGIAAYFVSQNRFRVLVPAAERGGGEVLLQFLERYFAALGQVGLDAQRTATLAVVLIQFIHVSAHATASHQWPGEQRLLKHRLSKLDRADFPNIDRFRTDYLQLAGDTAFNAGLGLILAGLARERRTRAADLKLLQRSPQARSGTSNRKAALEL